MILKRLSVVAVLVLMFAYIPLAYADDFPGTSIPTGTDTSSIISDAEINYGIANKNQPALDAQQSYDLAYIAPPHELQVTVRYNGYVISTNYGELAYGSPHGDYSGGHYRYLGYTFEGDNYTNIAYPPDVVPNGANFETQQWIKNPWTYSTLGAITVVPTPWDGQAAFTDPATGISIPTNLLLQVGMYYLNQTTGVGGVDGQPGSGYTFDLGDGNPLWSSLDQYADIMMPPTRTTWGMARMFHMYNNYPYYVDIPILPLTLAVEIPVLVVSPPSATIEVGEMQQFNAVYFFSGMETRVTTSSNWTDDNPAVATIVPSGSNAGLATGLAEGTTNITCTYVDANNFTLTGAAVLTVKPPQPVLIITPPSQAIYVGGRANYTDILYPNSQDAANGTNGTDVTMQSAWSSGDDTIATPAAPGSFNGIAPGTTTVTASYTPLGGNLLSATAGLAVQQQPGSVGTGILSFQAYNQPHIQTLYGRQVGGMLKRGPNIALWTDSVTATLAVPQPPIPTNIPNGGIFTGFIDWVIANATLSGIPVQNPSFTFDNPVEPSTYRTLGMNSQGAVSSGNATAVSPVFEEDWSEDGIGYGTGGPQGIMDAITGQRAAIAPRSFQLSATYVENYTYTYIYWVPGSNGQPGYWATGTASGSTGTLTAAQALWVCGTGAVPVTGTGGHLAVVASLANPQTHP